EKRPQQDGTESGVIVLWQWQRPEGAVYWLVEIERAFGDEAQHREGGNWVADRRGLEERSLVDVSPRRQLKLSVCARPRGFAGLDCRELHARHAVMPHALEDSPLRVVAAAYANKRD